jgi:hypothetical protein
MERLQYALSSNPSFDLNFEELKFLKRKEKEEVH